jgi:hypothetical protein
MKRRVRINQGFRRGWSSSPSGVCRRVLVICREKIGRRDAGNNELSVVFVLGQQLLPLPYPMTLPPMRPADGRPRLMVKEGMMGIMRRDPKAA